MRSKYVFLSISILAITLFGSFGLANAQGVSNFSLSSSHCVITASFTATDGGGTYRITSWDDGNQVYDSGLFTLNEGESVTTQIYTGPVILQGAAGIGVYVQDASDNTLVSNSSYNADVTQPCGSAGGLAFNSYAGPPIPEGFVQKYLKCSTAVFDSPGGNPVGNAAVYFGQAFYVSTTPVKDANGKLWIEIFVSSSPNPYIPASCVD
jgi:hypothetical protein